MKFLYFGDRHYSEKQPKVRIDDFLETTKKKDEEILALGKKYDVEAFLQPGDFFNENEVEGENNFINSIFTRWGVLNSKDLIDCMKNETAENKDLLEKAKNYKPIIGVAGNHDLIGNSLESLKDTTLGLVSNLGLITLVDKEHPVVFTTKDGVKVAITGTSYHLYQDDKDYKDDYIVKEKLGDVHIHIVHGMLSEKDLGPLIKHTLIDDCLETKADITLCGHNHIGFGVLKYGEKYFVNIGSLTRFTGEIKDIKRTPSVALIDIDKTGFNVTEIPLSCAKKGEEVIDRTSLDFEKKKKESIKKFRDEARAMKDSSTKPDMSDFVVSVAKSSGIPDEIKNDLLERITEQEKSLNKTKTGAVDAYIEKIILENFQSHKYNEFDLSKNFNVFVGESRQGKSAILRAFYWVLENKPSGKNFIKKGEDFARVTIVLSNKTSISRIVEQKGKNGYEIMYPDGTMESGNTKLLPKVQTLVGYNEFKIDDKLSLNVNCYKQGDPWFLIGKGLTSTDKARAIGALNGTNIADAIVRDLDLENSKYLTAYKLSQKSIEETKEELKSFEYLDDLKTLIEKFELSVETFEKLKDQKEKIEKTLEKIKVLDEKITESNETLKTLEVLQSLNKNILKAKETSLIRNSIEEKYEKYLRTSENLKNTEVTLSKLTKLSDISSNIEKMKDLSNLYEKIDFNYKRIVKSNEDLKKHIEIIDKTSSLPAISKNIDTLKTKQTEYTELLEKVEKVNKLLEKQEKTVNNLKVLDAELDKLQVIEDLKECVVEFHYLNTYYLDIKKSLDKLNEKEEILKKQKEKIDLQTKNIEDAKENYEKVLKEVKICPICNKPLENHEDHN